MLSQTVVAVALAIFINFGLTASSSLDFSQENSFSEELFGDKIQNYDKIDPGIVEDSLLKVPELIKKYNYSSEIHKVETSDGYILEMHRIPKPGAQPVFLMHGLLDSSSTWVIMGPNKGFAYMLSNLGYDVWMGNARGNRYSKNHKFLSPKENKFWKFSFHEIGMFDLSASIDYVLNATGYEKLQYIGHSQGTITLWILCSERPEYANKIMSMQALAPVAYLDHIKSPLINIVLFFMKNFAKLITLIGPGEFLPNTEFVRIVSQYFCKDGALTQEICSNVIFAIAGYNEKQMNKTMIPVVTGHTPAGASTKQIIHFAQISKSGKLRQYDYGAVQNLVKYGSIWPPNYSFSNVKVKVALHYSANDWLSQPRDIEKLHQELPIKIGKFLVDDINFNHLDFVWGIDVIPFCYERVVNIMRLVENGEI